MAVPLSFTLPFRCSPAVPGKVGLREVAAVRSRFPSVAAANPLSVEWDAKPPDARFGSSSLAQQPRAAPNFSPCRSTTPTSGFFRLLSSVNHESKQLLGFICGRMATEEEKRVRRWRGVLFAQAALSGYVFRSVLPFAGSVTVTGKPVSSFWSPIRQRGVRRVRDPAVKSVLGSCSRRWDLFEAVEVIKSPVVAGKARLPPYHWAHALVLVFYARVCVSFPAAQACPVRRSRCSASFSS